MIIKIFPYSSFSKSGKALSQATGWKRIKRERSRFKGSPRKTVINWGCTLLPDEVMRCLVVNHPVAVERVSNKLSFFRHMDEEGLTPIFTEDMGIAAQWIADKGRTVVCRTVLNGREGKGIVIAEKQDELVEAPLYVRYMKKTSEYRVHVGFLEDVKEAFFIQKKVSRKGDVPQDWKVRSHRNGFVFQQNNLDPVPLCVQQAAEQAMTLCELDFGAVDVIYNVKYDKAYVLEVNSAPGLDGSTPQKYAEMLKEIVPY